ARLSARLNHPNVVQVSEVIEGPRGPMLVMEYLDGLSLRGIYANAQHEFSPAMRLRVLCDVLAGLHHAHELTDYDGAGLGIVHRDVTPQNVFVTYDGSVKLVDFGIAKVTASADLTLVGVVKGKVQYMPIEQLTNAKIDRRADIYSVGCLLWEAAAGRRMWPNQDRAEIMRSIIRGELPSLSSRVDVDPELERIVSRAMAREPEDRFPTALDMRLALEQYLQSLPPVTMREVGELLCRVSGDARVKRQRSIADAIALLDAQPVSSLPPLDATPNALESTFTHAPVVKPRRSMGVIAIPLLAFLIGLGTWAWMSRSAQPPPASAAAPREERTLTVRAVPLDARVTIDERRLDGNPASSMVTAGTEHIVRVAAAGYDDTERHIRVDNDTSVMIELEARPRAIPVEAPAASAETKHPVAASEHAKARRHDETHPAPAASASEVPAAADRPNCDPPYYFSDGIKTYRPECI
ncbi:MAG TPA: serine/threonine-protein kinase, partial [Polyangiaceae bacterium]